MKNTKLTVGLIACLLSVGGLAGCSKVKSSDDGVLLTYTIESEEHKVVHKITADEILAKSYDDSSKYQAIYDVIYSVLVKNYFNRDSKVQYYNLERTIGKGQMGNPNDVAHGSEGSIYGKANQKVDDDKDTAHTNADANNTSYKKQLEAILDSKGVKTVEELKEKYVEEIQKETFEKNFYTYYIEDLKLGAGTTQLIGDDEANAKAAELKDFWPGYFVDQLPYHVSHILVKLEDGSGTNYADGVISEANAKKLYDVVKALADDSKEADTFSTIAKQYSEDTGSAKLSGDLGIMDTSTGFVNEFKLGVYAYENYYGKDAAKAKESNINAQDETISKDYAEAVAKSFSSDELVGGVPTISSEVFTLLRDAASEEKDELKAEVLDDEKSLYPRNIIYNKYLNRHSVAFITGAAEASADASHGYHTYTEGKLAGAGKILSVKVAGEWRPILCVRAGSDYQGIHFIVVNRSPFETGADANGVDQSTYYTTFYPDQDMYKTITGGKGPTYVNFSSKDSDVTATKKRAEELASKLKSFDSDRLSKYIFLKYLSEEKVIIRSGVTIKDENGNDVDKLDYRLKKWIQTSVDKAAAEREETWTKTWTEYIDTLSRQGSERSKLVPEACRLAYTYANRKNQKIQELPNYSEIKALLVKEGIDEPKADTLIEEWFKVKGGLCNNGKEYVK